MREEGGKKGMPIERGKISGKFKAIDENLGGVVVKIVLGGRSLKYI